MFERSKIEKTVNEVKLFEKKLYYII